MFPDLISAPFHSGLHAAFGFAIGACLVAAIASWPRGDRYHWSTEEQATGQSGAVADGVAANDMSGPRTNGTGAGTEPEVATIGGRSD